MSFEYEVGNRSIGAKNADGTPSSIMLDVAYGEFGKKHGYVDAEGTGILGEFGKGFARGGVQFLSSAANTLGMDEVHAKTQRFMAENADWFSESARKSEAERFANWAGATIGNYTPMLLAQVGAAAMTGGGSAVATGASISARALSMTRAARLATAGVSMLQTYGDNVDRLAKALPDIDPSERRGMAFFISATQAGIEGMFGAERLLSKELAVNRLLSKALTNADRPFAAQLGRAMLGQLPKSGAQIAISGAEEGLEGLLQEVSFDVGVALKGGDLGALDDAIRRYKMAFLEEAKAGLLIGAFPATLHAYNNIRAQALVSGKATKQMRDEVDASPVSANGSLMVDQAARRKTEVAFEELRAALPPKYARVADLIENLSYKWAYEAHKKGDTNFRPEQMIDTLRTAILTDSPEHSAALIKIVDDGEAAGLLPEAIYARQYAYIRDNMKGAASLLHDLQERIELRLWKDVIKDLGQELDKKAPRFTRSEQAAIAQKAGQIIQMPIVAGDIIPARMVVDAFADTPELLRRAYVYGRIDDVRYGSQKVSLVLNSDLSARVVSDAGRTSSISVDGPLGTARVEQESDVVVDEQLRQLDLILATGREGAVVDRKDETGKTMRDDDKFLEGVIFSSTVPLAKSRAASLRGMMMLNRADQFDTVWRVAAKAQVVPDATPAMRAAAMKMGFTKAEVESMSPAQLAAIMPRGWKPKAEAEIIAARTAGVDVAPDITTLEDYVNEAIAKQKEAEAKAQAEALEAEAKLQEQQRLGKIDAEVRAQLERTREKLERIRNERALASRNAVAEFYRRYPEYASLRFEEEKQKAIQEAAVAVEDGELRTRLLELTSARGEALAQQEMQLERPARRVDEYKTLQDAMKALEARNPELARRIQELQTKETNLRVAMALRMLPDEPTVLRQGTLGQYIPEVRLALFYQGADATTVVHELFHHFIENRLMPNVLMEAIDRAFAIKGSAGERQWTLASKENAANAFLAYVKDNKLPKGSRLLEAFRHIHNAIQNHLEDLMEKTMGPKGASLETTGRPLDLSPDLKQWFNVGLKPRAKDEASVIYGRALTDSVLASDPAAELELDQSIMAEAANIDNENADVVVRHIMEDSPAIYRGAKDYKKLSLAQKLHLKAQLRELIDVTDKTPVVKPKLIFPDGLITRRQKIVDGVMRQLKAEQKPLDARSEADPFERASKLADDMTSGDVVLRQKAKDELKLLGLTEEELKPNLDNISYSQVLNAVMQNWAKYYGYSLNDRADKKLLMDALRAEVLDRFGFHKIVNGQKVGSLSEKNGMTKEKLVELMIDDSKLEGPDLDLLVAQEYAASDINKLNVEGYRSLQSRSDDFAVKRGTISAFRWLNETWSNPYQLIDYLTGGNINNPLMVIAENMRNGFRESKRLQEAYTKELWEVLNKAGVDLADMADTLDVAGWKLTKSQVAMLYTMSNWGTNWDTKHIQKLRASKHFVVGDKDDTDAVVRAAVKIFNTELKDVKPVLQWMDAIARQEYDVAREIAQSIGKEVPQATEDRYAPIVFLDGRIDPDTADGYLANMFLADSRYRQDSANPSWLMERSELGSGSGMNLDYFSLMYRHMIGMYHFKANAKWIHDALTLLQDQWINGQQINPIRDAIKDKFGDDNYYNALVQYVKRAASPTYTLRNDPLSFADKLIARLRKNLAPTALSWNFWIPLLQPLSGLHVIGQLGFKAGMKYALEVAKIMLSHRMGIKVIGGTAIDELPIFKEVQRLAPEQASMFKSIYDREVHFGLERLRGQKLNAAGWEIGRYKFGQLVENGLIPLNVSDAYFRITAWKVAYDTKREELSLSNKWSASEKHRIAVNYANRIVSQSMNPADPNEKPLAISEGSEFFKAVMAFSGQPLAEHRAYMREFVIPFLSTYRMIKDAQGSRAEALKKAFATLATSTQMHRWLFTMALPGIGLGMLSRKRLPTYSELIFDIVAGGLLTKIPIIGPAMWTQAIYGVSLSEDIGNVGPLSSAMSAFSDVYEDALRLVDPDKHGKLTPAKLLNSVRKSADVIMGIPDFGPRIVTRSMVMMLDEGREFDDALKRSIGIGVR